MTGVSPSCEQLGEYPLSEWANGYRNYLPPPYKGNPNGSPDKAIERRQEEILIATLLTVIKSLDKSVLGNYKGPDKRGSIKYQEWSGAKEQAIFWDPGNEQRPPHITYMFGEDMGVVVDDPDTYLLFHAALSNLEELKLGPNTSYHELEHAASAITFRRFVEEGLTPYEDEETVDDENMDQSNSSVKRDGLVTKLISGEKVVTLSIRFRELKNETYSVQLVIVSSDLAINGQFVKYEMGKDGLVNRYLGDPSNATDNGQPVKLSEIVELTKLAGL